VSPLTQCANKNVKPVQNDTRQPENIPSVLMATFLDKILKYVIVTRDSVNFDIRTLLQFPAEHYLLTVAATCHLLITQSLVLSAQQTTLQLTTWQNKRAHMTTWWWWWW